MLKLLDLFCGSGGCSKGYIDAGFDVTGVDIDPQPYYPFKFIQADALTFDLSGFDVIHASPPCQAYSVTKRITGKRYPDLLQAVRHRLIESDKPWIIENVPGSPLDNPVWLNGLLFDLRVIRKRGFETSFEVEQPVLANPPKGCTGSHRGYSKDTEYITVAGNNYNREQGAKAMGIDWYIPRAKLSQCIPPAYTEWIAQWIQ